MNAFEQLVSEIYFNMGFWTTTGYKISLTSEEKRKIERFSSPRWEIDVVAYSGRNNEVHAIECKSFLDSPGVTIKEFQESSQRTKGRYKLFNEAVLREAIFHRLRNQLHEEGLTSKDPLIRLCLVAGKIKKGEEKILTEYFNNRAWILYGPDWVRNQLKKISLSSYSDQVCSMVAKILLRE